MVVDACVLIAILFDEPHTAWAAHQLNLHANSLKMSTVNLTETLMVLRARSPKDFPKFESQVFNLGIQFISPSVEQSQRTAELRYLCKVNLGDCFALSLAEQEKVPVLTIDADFKKIKHHKILMP